MRYRIEHLFPEQCIAYEYNIDKDDVFPAWAPMFHMASNDLAIGSVIIGGSIAFVDGFKSELLN